MVHGYHIIWSAYGFWLPNDPRGSWSSWVGSWELFRAGGSATKTTETCSLARRPHDRAARVAVKRALQRPPVRFDGHQALAVANGFAGYARRSGLPVWACAVMPDHVHLVTGRFRLNVEQVVIQLKAAATARLTEERRHPFQDIPKPDGRLPKCFAEGSWNVFLDTVEDIGRAVRYVERNPVKDGLRPQRWSFVSACPLLQQPR